MLSTTIIKHLCKHIFSNCWILQLWFLAFGQFDMTWLSNEYCETEWITRSYWWVYLKVPCLIISFQSTGVWNCASKLDNVSLTRIFVRSALQSDSCTHMYTFLHVLQHLCFYCRIMVAMLDVSFNVVNCISAPLYTLIVCCQVEHSNWVHLFLDKIVPSAIEMAWCSIRNSRSYSSASHFGGRHFANMMLIDLGS